MNFTKDDKEVVKAFMTQRELKSSNAEQTVNLSSREICE